MTDFEKVLMEAQLLNPGGNYTQTLPGEEYHSVGQNPKCGSSIGATHHTQIARASCMSHPLYQLESRPQYSDVIDGKVDIVQVGKNEDAFFVRFSELKDLRSPSLLDVIYNLRLSIVQQFGAHHVDFNVKAFSDKNGSKVVIFGVITMLEKLSYGNLKQNPDTGETSENHVLGTIDTQSAAGDVMVYSPAKWESCLKGGKDVLL
eukprot:TRINITY_DN7765_c0_g1_i2.p1 TRINITY_DN7765_c0_g1~~TRINITY_DN7765_c0_g1_i2.p1  ORF type:complete len:204 (+),score=73.44 TRINITY_DN7765_c0_g1_i2:71-682(+)